MPNQPSMSGVHVDRPLTMLSVAAIQESRNFMHDRLFAKVPVQNRTDTYFSFTTDDLMRDEAKERAPGAKAAMSGFDVDGTNTYRCRRFDIGKRIPDDIRANATSPMDLESSTMAWILQKLRIRQERLFDAQVMAASVWGTDNTPGTLWDVATSDPFTDFDTSRNAVLLASGFEPNVIGVGYRVHLALKKHPLVIERVKYVAGRSFNLAVSPMNEAEAALAAAFEVDDYVVSRAVYSSTEENASTNTQANAVTATDAVMLYRTKSPSLMTPSAGYCLTEQRFGGNDEGIRIKKYRDNEHESDVIEGAFSKVNLVTFANAGYRWGAAVS